MKAVTETTKEDRSAKWIGTSYGFEISQDVIAAHSEYRLARITSKKITRVERENLEYSTLADGATLAAGAGERFIPEDPDPVRTCFERDRDRILHSTAFRRLAGKTQVFIFPSDHQRTRLTHALEVSQVARAISQGIGLNSSLTEAIALGHDCGHGPGGHASEDAFSQFMPGGFDHAVWGADHSLASLNLCKQTLDGIRNHSWSRPQPATPEGVVVSLADRIAYCAHDLEDAMNSGVVNPNDIPASVASMAGTSRSEHLRFLINDVITTVQSTGVVGLSPQASEVLSDLRLFNYQNIYMRPESVAQSVSVIQLLKQLVEYFIFNPIKTGNRLSENIKAGSEEAIVNAVEFTSGMTDRFAFQKAVELLGYDIGKLPIGIDINKTV